jgi:predicted RNase H-like HicB family nuclease
MAALDLEGSTAPKAGEAPPRKPIASAEGKGPIYNVRMTELPDGRLRGTIPDLPGCEAEGATLDEMLESLRRAKQEWIVSARAEGRDWPAPLSSEEARHDADHYACFAVLDGWEYDKTENPVFAFRALAYALLAFPDFPLSDAVKRYFLKAANKLELHPSVIGKVDPQRVVGELAQRLGFTSKGANKLAAAKNRRNDQALLDRIQIEHHITGKSITAIVNERAANQIGGNQDRQLWRKMKRGKRWPDLPGR